MDIYLGAELTVTDIQIVSDLKIRLTRPDHA